MFDPFKLSDLLRLSYLAFLNNYECKYILIITTSRYFFLCWSLKLIFKSSTVTVDEVRTNCWKPLTYRLGIIGIPNFHMALDFLGHQFWRKSHFHLEILSCIFTIRFLWGGKIELLWWFIDFLKCRGYLSSCIELNVINCFLSIFGDKYILILGPNFFPQLLYELFENDLIFYFHLS